MVHAIDDAAREQLLADTFGAIPDLAERLPSRDERDRRPTVADLSAVGSGQQSTIGIEGSRNSRSIRSELTIVA